jgi:very-short-patch-repair endonuclease
VIHTSRHPIPGEDIKTIDGIPVTKPARTLLDLATVEPQRVIERCLDDMLRRRLVSLSFLDRWLNDDRRKRHRGASLLRTLVDKRATIGVTDSDLETELLTLLREAGLPIPMLQYVVEHDGLFIARPDFAYPEQRVAIEADGFRFHDRRDTFDRERARGNELEALGWLVLRITGHHIERDPKAVVSWVSRALGQRARP